MKFCEKYQKNISKSALNFKVFNWWSKNGLIDLRSMISIASSSPFDYKCKVELDSYMFRLRDNG